MIHRHMPIASSAGTETQFSAHLVPCGRPCWEMSYIFFKRSQLSLTMREHFILVDTVIFL